MTLRFGLQIVIAIGLVAILGETTFARDDDPRDFRRNDNRYENNSSGRNNNQNNGNYNQNDRDRDERDRDRDDRDDDRPKVTICHNERDDDDRRAFGKTIQVSQSAVAAHQRHGDTLGPCPQSPRRPQDDDDRDRERDRDERYRNDR